MFLPASLSVYKITHPWMDQIISLSILSIGLGPNNKKFTFVRDKEQDVDSVFFSVL